MLKKKHHKKKQSFFKKWSSKLHLWFGLAIGFLIFIISITGALFVFKEDIENYSRQNVIFHHEQNSSEKKQLPIRELEKRVNQQTSEKYPIHWVNVPINPKESYKFYWYEHNDKAWNYFEEYPIYKVAYVNPYSGKVLKVYDEKNGFFNIVKMIHWSFLLKESWGKYIVGIPVIIFVGMLITGIILWWPKNKAARKQRFWFRWKNIKNWKRKNYDLHNIVGFYSSVFALIFAITGLFYAFIIIQATIYVLFSGGNTVYPDYSSIKTTAPIALRNETTIDTMANYIWKHYPKANSFSIDLGHPHLDDHEHPNFEIYVQHLPNVYYKYSSVIFDENSGQPLKVINYSSKNLGEKAVAANYDIHVGAILGWPTKIIAFIVSLMIASMSITGFMIWWGRRKKKK